MKTSKPTSDEFNSPNQFNMSKPEKPIPDPIPTNFSNYNYPSPFFTAYGARNRIQTTFTGLGRTKQSFKAESDINTIMARYKQTGLIEFQQKHPARFGDCIGLDFEGGMQTVAKAKALFAALPAALRLRFNNDPGELLDFVQDRRNKEEAQALGLLKPQEPVGDVQKPDRTPPSAPPMPNAAKATGSSPKGASQASEGAPTPKGD